MFPRMQVHSRCGVKLHLSERKMGIMRCLDLPGVLTTSGTGLPPRVLLELHPALSRQDSLCCQPAAAARNLCSKP